jgi:hypothetical protein
MCGDNVQMVVYKELISKHRHETNFCVMGLLNMAEGEANPLLQ